MYNYTEIHTCIMIRDTDQSSFPWNWTCVSYIWALEIIMEEKCIQRVLLMAAPAAVPGTLGVEHHQPSGLKSDDIWSWRRLRENNGIPVVHVVCPIREQLPQEAPSSAPSFPGGIQEDFVHCADEGVAEWWVVAIVFWRYTKLSKHNRHSQVLLTVLYVGLHPWSGEVEMGISDRLRNPPSTNETVSDARRKRAYLWLM